jgi:hypothetical protein
MPIGSAYVHYRRWGASVVGWMNANASHQFPRCPGESTVLEAFNGTLVLTTHRVRLDNRSSGESQLISMTLDAVASSGVVTRSSPWLLVLALAFGVAAIIGAKEGGTIAPVLFFTGALCVVAYFATRRAILAISSAGETIAVPIRGAALERLVAFVNALEQAKLAMTLNGTQNVADSGPVLRSASQT